MFRNISHLFLLFLTLFFLTFSSVFASTPTIYDQVPQDTSVIDSAVSTNVTVSNTAPVITYDQSGDTGRIPRTPSENIEILIKSAVTVYYPQFVDSRFMEADWIPLYNIWFLNKEPKELGTWTIVDNVPTVAITDKKFIHDLQSRPQYLQAINKFKIEHSDFSKIMKNDTTEHSFIYTLDGAITGRYNIVEGFLGSYLMKITALEKDTSKYVVPVKFEVFNCSHWQSGSRLPPNFIQIIGTPYLVPNVPRGSIFPGGTFCQQFIGSDIITY
ncbi:MAG: hypothetical protein WCO06_02975 [Candidatus Roizmanbacteria bacterium]